MAVRTDLTQPDLTRLARTLGDATRIQMLALLMSGQALTAKELAYRSGIKPATATGHLQRLEEDRFIQAQAQGRHKYFRLASPEVAQLVEAMMALAPQNSTGLARQPANDPIRVARFCYDHLAGQLGTQITETLLARTYLIKEERAFLVTEQGKCWLREFGLDLDALAHTRRKFAPCCLDWSERKDHVAGALGAALAGRMIGLEWLVRNEGSRVVTITEAGRAGLLQNFDLR